MRILILTLILTLFSIAVNAQGFIGSTQSVIADSMKKQDSYDFGKKTVNDGVLILTYLNYMHKDQSYKINDDFVLMSSQFQIQNDKCIGEFYLYKDVLLNKFVTTFNNDTIKYKAVNAYEWVDKINNISIKITKMPEQNCFFIQYRK